MVRLICSTEADIDSLFLINDDNDNISSDSQRVLMDDLNVKEKDVIFLNNLIKIIIFLFRMLQILIYLVEMKKCLLLIEHCLVLVKCAQKLIGQLVNRLFVNYIF